MTRESPNPNTITAYQMQKAEERAKRRQEILEIVGKVCKDHNGHAEIGNGIFIYDSNKFKVVIK